jgi:Domain of unknown function (DUF4956)
VRFFKRMIDLFTLGSERPMRRLLAYYLVLAAVTTTLVYSFPIVDRMFSGERAELIQTPRLLADGLVNAAPPPAAGLDRSARLELAVSTTLICFGTIALMLPVSWVYMSTRSRGHSQAIVQTLIILPIIVAGIILVVRNSLALAFSLAGVVSVLRFRTTLSDTRDILYIFLAVAVGFAAGVQLLLVAVILSVIFNFTLLLTWRYDFGRNVLVPTASSKWSEPLNELAKRTHGVPDRDLVLALTAEKVDFLTERFKHVRGVLGGDANKPRYNGILTVTTNGLAEAQAEVERALATVAKRWTLDEVVTNEGKPSELYYLVKIRKSTASNDVLTAIRSGAGHVIVSASVEIGDARAREVAQKKAAAKALRVAT